jgi:hypothetical protein
MDFTHTISALLGHNWSERTFRAHFGVSSVTAIALWLHLLEQPFYSFQAHHLLWTLHWLKVHNSLDVAASRFACDRHTYSMWVWRVILVLFFTLNTVHFNCSNDLLNRLMQVIDSLKETILST